MYKTSSIFRMSNFRNRVVTCLLLTILSFSFLPSISLAQQPTATVKTLSGDVLVSGQAATVGTVLQAGETIETQAGASVVLELSDGSTLELRENTKIDIAVLSQTAVGARVSRVKLLWGRIRAFLSPQHQIEGSSFDIETPNALIGAKFSEPDIEVSYNLEKAETVGIAHTVELMAKNLLTNEDVLVPVGSSVIITTVGIKVIAGIIGIGGASSVGSTGTGTASTTASIGSTGMGTGTKVAIGAGAAAAAGGVAALAVSSGGSGDGETAESTGDLSGMWHFITGPGVSQGCTEDTPCRGRIDGGGPDPERCGINACGPFDYGGQYAQHIRVTQIGNTLSSPSDVCPTGESFTFTGIVNGNSVSFTIQGGGHNPAGLGPDATTNFTGVIDGNTIRGDFSGGVVPSSLGITWTGIFTLTIERENK